MQSANCCVYSVCPECPQNIAHLADTFVVKETQSVTKDSGVVPVMSSHCAGDIPPARDRGQKMSLSSITLT